MSGQKYKRTNFDDDDNTSMGGTPPGVTYDPAIAFKVGASFWQKRSWLEKLQFVLVVVLVVVIVVLACLLSATPKPKLPAELCTTPACVNVASSILSSLDTSVDPCEDFYEYSCGGWVKAHPIPSGQSRWGTFGVMWQENQVVMKNVLEQPLNASLSEAERKAKLYYQSCMDKNKTVEKLGAQPLDDLLRSFGGWNISTRTGQWNVSAWSYQTQLERLHGLGLSVFFVLWVGEDEKNSNTNILQLDQSGLGLAREQYLNKTVTEDPLLSAYLKFMVDLGELMGGDRNETEEQMIRVIEFEQQLANITTPQEDREDEMEMYHKISLADLQRDSPFINWVEYLNNLLTVSNIQVTDKEKLVLFDPAFMKQLSDLIIETVKTDEGKSTLNNYMLWHLVKMMASYLSKPFRNAKKEFSEVLSGVTGSDEEWRYCTSDTDSILGFALGGMFVREAFKGNRKAKAEDMIGEVKEAFKRNLPNLQWMDDETRQAAIDKANAVIDKIGFPPYILNKTELDDKYKELQIKPDEYFMNNFRELKYNIKRNFDKLRKAPDKKSWSMTPPTVNAYYTPTKNEIVFPAGILQAPFYDRDYPKSLNFGGMGVVMGHELTHGFDDQGRQYDKFGILRPWWNNASVSRFKERTQCMVDQYSSYQLNGENVRGKRTLGENIADNGGMKSSFLAYQDWVDEHGAEKPLPGLALTHQQLFFIAFAQVWCSNSKPQADHMGLITDSHAPAKFRVLGTVSNSIDFSHHFNCRPGQAMNPKKKCEVW